MKRFVHVGVTVSDLERSVAFYRDVLQFPFVKISPGYSEGKAAEENSKGIGVENVVLRSANLKLPGFDDAILELLHYKSPASERETAVKPNTVGSMHIAYFVEDFMAEFDRLKEAGVSIPSIPQRDGDEMWVYFRDPDDIPVELMGKVK